MLKTITYAMIVSGALLASAGAAAQGSLATAEGGIGYTVRTSDRANNPFPDQSKSNDYGIRISKSGADSVFPDQSKSNDYGVRISKSSTDSVFPDQSKSNDYGIRIAA